MRLVMNKCVLLTVILILYLQTFLTERVKEIQFPIRDIHHFATLVYPPLPVAQVSIHRLSLLLVCLNWTV